MDEAELERRLKEARAARLELDAIRPPDVKSPFRRVSPDLAARALERAKARNAALARELEEKSAQAAAEAAEKAARAAEAKAAREAEMAAREALEARKKRIAALWAADLARSLAANRDFALQFMADWDYWENCRSTAFEREAEALWMTLGWMAAELEARQAHEARSGTG